MGIVVLIVSFLILFLQIYKNKDRVINPITFFFALWTFILLLSSLNLYGMHKPSWEAYLLIGLMEIFFYLGSILSKKQLSIMENLKKSYTQHLKCKNVNYIIIYILIALIILFNVIDIFIVIKYYSYKVPMWQIRNWVLSPFGSSNPILNRRVFAEEVIRTLILTPSIIVIYPIVSYTIFNDKNKKRKIFLLILSICMLITGSIANGGGRLGLLYYLLCICLSFLIKYDKMKTSDSDSFKRFISNYRKIIILVVCSTILLVVGFTILRTNITSVLKQFYTYFAMGPTLLSEWLPKIKKMPHTFGLLTFFGFHSYFFRLFKMIGMDFLVPNVFNNAFSYMLNAETFIEIGSGNSNAFVTPIYYFYLDGGYFYTVFASLLFGYFISKFYIFFRRNINIKSFTIYSIIMYAVFISFIRIQTVIPSYIISFIIAYVLFSNELSKIISSMKMFFKKIFQNSDHEGSVIDEKK